MSAANPYSPTHRQWDHIGNLFPNVEHAEKEHGRLAGDFIPAPWLPVQTYDKHFEAWYVISPGKVVAFASAEDIKTNMGDHEDSTHVVPAGLKLAFAVGSGDVLTYTADDVTERVIDLTTGVPVTAAAGYTRAELTTALISRGLITPSQNAEDLISYPVGVAAHAMFKWAGLNGAKFDPSNLANHNFRLQHQVQILVAYQLRLPWMPVVATQTDTAGAALTSAAGDAANIYGSGNLFSSSDVLATVRYSTESNTNFIALALTHAPVAGPTTLTPVTVTPASGSVRLRNSIATLSAAGDYYLDREVGLMFFYVSGGATVPAWVNGLTVEFQHYDGVPASASIGNYTLVTSSSSDPLQAGDFLVCDINSNFARDTGPTSYSAYRLGQVIGFKSHPRDLLHKVRTQYKNLGVLNQAAGSATGGLPDTLTFSTAADKEVVVNLINR